MDAAVTVFARRGVEAAPISEIAATAKVSNGTFYYHFKDKAELIDAVGHAVAAALVNQVDEEIKAIESGAERVAVEAAVRMGWERYIGMGGKFVGMTGFGASAPIEDLFKHFGITAEAVAQAALDVA